MVGTVYLQEVDGVFKCFLLAFLGRVNACVCIQELDNLFRKLDKDQDGRVSLTEFQSGLFIHGDLPEPKAASTPARLIAQCSFPQVSTTANLQKPVLCSAVLPNVLDV